MTTMNVSVSDELKSFVDAQIADGGYSTVSEYIRALLRDAQKRVAHEKLDRLLLEGLDSGPSQPITPEFWDELRARAQARIQARKNKSK